MAPIAVQMYSLREEAQKDLFGTLRRVAEIGYAGVEIAGLHGHDAAEVGKFIKELGLKVCSSHVALPTAENVEEIAKTERALGNMKVISTLSPETFATMAGCVDTAAKFQNAADLLKPYGMTFGFHNHWGEFYTVDGQVAYDVLMHDAPDVFGELDVYWTAYAKFDPVEVIRKYGHRLPILHLKDGDLDKDKPMLPVGSGVMDIPAIVKAADPNVLEWVVVELDRYDGDMFEAVEKSYEYLVSNGLASGR